MLGLFRESETFFDLEHLRAQLSHVVKIIMLLAVSFYSRCDAAWILCSEG